jgi:uncharacterized repeat protein (TIGR01451 family)
MIMVTARLTFAIAVALVAFAWWTGPAAAAVPAPGFTIHSFAQPTNFSTSHTTECETSYERCDAYVVKATNAGSQPTDGSEITLTDTLPAGLTVQRITFFWSKAEGDLGSFFCDKVTVRTG